MVVEITNCLDT